MNANIFVEDDRSSGSREEGKVSISQSALCRNPISLQELIHTSILRPDAKQMKVTPFIPKKTNFFSSRTAFINSAKFISRSQEVCWMSSNLGNVESEIYEMRPLAKSKSQNLLRHEHLLSIGQREGDAQKREWLERHSAEFFPSHIFFFAFSFSPPVSFYFLPFHVRTPLPNFFCMPGLTMRQIFRFVPSTLLFCSHSLLQPFLGSQCEAVILDARDDRGRTFEADIL